MLWTRPIHIAIEWTCLKAYKPTEVETPSAASLTEDLTPPSLTMYALENGLMTLA